MKLFGIYDDTSNNDSIYLKSIWSSQELAEAEIKRLKSLSDYNEIYTSYEIVELFVDQTECER